MKCYFASRKKCELKGNLLTFIRCQIGELNSAAGDVMRNKMERLYNYKFFVN